MPPPKQIWKNESSINIDDLKNKYDNGKTYANNKSILKRMNMLLDLTPVNYVHVHQYVANFEQLCAKMLSSGLVKSKSDLLSKLNSIVGVINRAGANASSLRMKIDALKIDNTDQIPAAYPTHNAPAWKDMLKMFDDEIENNTNPGAKIACVCFKHGYCLRIAEIYGTSTGDHRPLLAPNFLDLNGKMWYIREHKSKSTMGDREFPVTKEFVNELEKYISFRDFLLIYKSNLTMYSTHLLSTIGITKFSNNDVRNSYEQWNWHDSGRTKEESEWWSMNVLGHTSNTAKKFYTKHDTETKIMEKVKEQVSAPEPEPEPEPAMPEKPKKIKINIKPKKK